MRLSVVPLPAPWVFPGLEKALSHGGLSDAQSGDPFSPGAHAPSSLGSLTGSQPRSP